MRILGLILFSLLFFINQGLAFSPVTVNMIKDAQDYGHDKAQIPSADFLMPWTAYEEKAVKLNETTERAYLYTPYLLLATSARENTLQGQLVSMEDSEKILLDYSGFLVYSIVLMGDTPSFTNGCIATLRQNKKIITASQSVIPAETIKTLTSSKEPLYISQCYFYFLEKDIALNKTVILSVLTTDKHEHNFYFELAKIK